MSSFKMSEWDEGKCIIRALSEQNHAQVIQSSVITGQNLSKWYHMNTQLEEGISEPEYEKFYLLNKTLTYWFSFHVSRK
jgi:hypothetical protein